MRKTICKIGIALLILSLCSIASVNLSSCQQGTTLQPSENLQIVVFINHPLPNVVKLVRNVIITFVDIQNLLPLNTSLQEFNEHFKGAGFAIGMDAKQCWMTLAVSYDINDIGVAETYANQVCTEFQKAFSLNLTVKSKSHNFDNETNYIQVVYELGYFPFGTSSFEELSKYKPVDGFGRLITRDFIDKYSRDRDKGGLLYLYYTLNRVGQGLFSSDFQIGFCETEILNDRDYVNIDVNDRLNRTGSIVPSSQRPSTITLQIQKTYEIYTMNVENTSPVYDQKEEDRDIVLTYFLTEPLDDVTVLVKITKSDPDTQWTIIIAVIIIVVAIVISILVIKKRRRLGSSRRSTVLNTTHLRDTKRRW